MSSARPCERLHAVENRVRRRLGHLVHDPPVGEEHHAVGATRRGRLVRDHHDGLAELVRGTPHEGQELDADDCESSWPVGSSAKTISGRETSARAAATRCCWPPESSVGRCLSRVAQMKRVDDLLHPVAFGLAPRDVQRQPDVLERGQGRNEIECLEDEADTVAPHLRDLALGQGTQLDVADPRLSRRQPVETRHALHQRRLARTRGPHDRRERTVSELDVDAIDRPHLGVALAVDLRRGDGTRGDVESFSRACGQVLRACRCQEALRTLLVRLGRHTHQLLERRPFRPGRSPLVKVDGMLAWFQRAGIGRSARIACGFPALGGACKRNRSGRNAVLSATSLPRRSGGPPSMPVRRAGAQLDEIKTLRPASPRRRCALRCRS